MKSVQWFNAITLTVTAALAVNLGVVCLLYVVYLDSAPRLRDEWLTVRTVTAVFYVLAIAAAVAFHGQRRGRAWRDLAQLGLVAVLTAGGFVLYRTLT